MNINFQQFIQGVTAKHRNINRTIYAFPSHPRLEPYFILKGENQI